MDCRMVRGFYLRANREINCYCSTGEQVVLADLPKNGLKFNFIHDWYLAETMNRLRQSFLANRLPFPKHCMKCNYFNPAGKPQEKLFSTEIEWAHMEPMAACNLACLFCAHGIKGSERKYPRKPPHKLDPALYDRIIDDIASAGMRIKYSYFSGLGEPGLHEDVWAMVRKAKEAFETNFLVNTNGNIPFSEEILNSGLDKIKIALDDLNPERYSRYRVQGDVRKVIELTKKIAGHKRKLHVNHPEIIWQKVLFGEANNEQALIEYQELASDLGVDTIWFINTWTQGYSGIDVDAIPQIFPNIRVFDDFANVTLPLSELAETLDRLRNTPSLEGYFSLIWKIVHWCELNMNNRDMYQDYGKCEFADPALFHLRAGDKDHELYRQALFECLGGVAEAYAVLEDEEESDKYRRMLRQGYAESWQEWIRQDSASLK